MDWLLTAVLFIIALGVLICLHELGHFTMAKIFKVYCNEFSIGFGPALIHTRKEGKETYFSLRAIPLGGYVSMYGEEDAMSEEGLNLPPERSIEGIAKWKKAIVVSAGVIVNAVLALLIFAVANICFKTSAITNRTVISSSSALVQKGIQEDDRLSFVSYKLPGGEEVLGIEGTDNYYYVIDDDVTVPSDTSNHYVLTFSYYTDKGENNVANGLGLYKGYLKSSGEDTKNWTIDGKEDFYLPNLNQKFDGANQVFNFDVELSFTRENETNPINVTLPMNFNDNRIEDFGLALKVVKFYLPLNERIENTFIDFGESSVAVFKGIGMLFRPKGIDNLSSIVGIFKYSNTILTTRTFATYLRMWGMISVNLAIFNLLPFPGLDGWQLLVTAIEGISKKKVPAKFKAIMNIAGFVLLLGLMILIVAKDIIMW